MARAAGRTRLLGSFDPILHGWASREQFVGTHQGVVTMNGVFRPTVLVDGRVVGTWTLDAGRGLRVQALEPMTSATDRAVRRDAADVCRFLGMADAEVVIATGT